MRYFVIILALLLSSACAYQPKPEPKAASPVASHALYQQLVAELAISLNENGVLTKLDAPLIPTAFVWNDNYQLDSTPATFRYLGISLEEAVITELVKQDVHLREYRRKPSISVDDEGGYYLTRSKDEIANAIDAKYILVGTLSPVEHGTTVNAKVINYLNGDVITSANLHFPYRSQFSRQINMVEGYISRGEG